MANVVLDPHGRLHVFRVAPPDVASSAAATPPDWRPFFAAAEIDATRLTPLASDWTPPMFADTRMAWQGEYPELTGVPVRIEAAAYRGLPVYFAVLGPSSSPERGGSGSRIAGFAQTLAISINLLALGGGAFLARRNLRMGRGDRQGAWRVATAAGALSLLAWVFGSDHMTRMDVAWTRLSIALSLATFFGAWLWLVYVALEPFVRRRWPELLISWTRLLAGGVRDPLVGRDILIGAVCGGALHAVESLNYYLPRWLGLPTPRPDVGAIGYVSSLSGIREPRQVVAVLFADLLVALGMALFALFILLVLRLILRKGWLANAAFVAVLTLAISVRGDTPAVELVCAAVIATIGVLLLVRVGLLAIYAEAVVALLLQTQPITIDMSAWYAGRSLIALAMLGAIGVYGFHTALAGRPLFGKMTLD